MKLSIYYCLLGLFLMCCTSGENVRPSHPRISAEKAVAIKNRMVMNGMTAEEVKIILGEPTFIDKTLDREPLERWIYRNVPGVTIGEEESYNPFPSFRQGIGYIIPLNYKCKEIRIDFKENKVCRIQKIISF